MLEHVVADQYKTPLAKPLPDFTSKVPAMNMGDLRRDPDTAAASRALHKNSHALF